jgi:integrase/recombinase XerD
MKANDLSVSMRNVQTSAVSKFYQDLKRFDDREDYDLPAPAPENPYERFDREDRDMYLKGRTKKSQGVEQEGDVYYLSPEKVKDLADNAPTPSLRNSLMIRLLFDTGLRRGELAKVKLSHIDRDDHSIYVPPRKSPQDRTVTYTPDYSGFLLDQWLDGTRGRKDRRSTYYADESDYLFPTNESEHISGYRINEIVKEAGWSSGHQKVVSEYSDGRKIHLINAHTLRHSHGVQAVKSEIDVRRLAESMGHIAEDGTVNLDTTTQYLRMAERDYIEASRKFDPY